MLSFLSRLFLTVAAVKRNWGRRDSVRGRFLLRRLEDTTAGHFGATDMSGMGPPSYFDTWTHKLRTTAFINQSHPVQCIC